MNMKFWGVVQNFWHVFKENWVVWGLIFLAGYELAYSIHHGMPM